MAEKFNIEELRQRIIESTGEAMRETQFDVTLDTNENLIVDSRALIVGVRKTVYNKADDKLLYSFEVDLLLDGTYRLLVEDINRGLSTVKRVNDREGLDNLLTDCNPFRDVNYSFIGDKFKV